MMTPQQFRITRAVLGLTQAELAEALDMSRVRVNQFERGRAPIPVVVALAMRTLRSEHGESVVLKEATKVLLAAQSLIAA